MFGDIKISPSILSADFMNFERDIRMLERGGTDFIHVDVMDGHFVPNLTLGVPFVSQLKKITDIPLDVHLMISNPLEQLDWYLKAGADWVSVHMEALHGEGEVREFIQRTREAGVHPALTLKLPADDPARTLLAWRGYCANPVSCAGSKQFRRTPTPQLYGGRILFYDKRTAPRGALQTPPDKAAGKAKGPQRRPGAD